MGWSAVRSVARLAPGRTRPTSLIWIRCRPLAKRVRRDERQATGIFTDSSNDAIDAYDNIIGLDLVRGRRRRVSAKVLLEGEGTGKNPTDRAKSVRGPSLTFVFA
jgi:hypothetical protein